MKPYERRREPGPIRRFLFVALLVMVAMLYGFMAAILPPQLLSWPVTPLLIMIALILWLLPDIGGIQYDRMQTFMIAYIAFSNAWPIYIAFNIPGLPWISMTRIILFCLLTVFIWNFSTSQQMRNAVRDSLSESSIAAKVFWAYWITTAVSLVFASPMGSAISKFLNNQIYWTMIFLVSCLLATRPGYVKRFSSVALAAAAIMFIFGIYEYTIRAVPWLGYLPPFLKIDPDLLEILAGSQSRAGTNIYRVRGPFVVSLVYSEFLTMMFPFFLYFVFKERRVFASLALISATIGCLVIMYLTNARSAVLGALVALVLYPFYYGIRKRSQNSRSIVGTSLLMAYPMIVALSAAVVMLWPRAHVMVLGGGQHQASSDARSEQWRMGIPKLLSHPLGYGVGRGNEALGYTNQAGVGTVDTYYLTVLLDSGAVALPLFMLTFLIPAWLAFKYYRDARSPEQELLAPLSIALVNFMIVKSVLTSEVNIPLAFAFVGCIIGLVWQRNRLPQPGDPPLASIVTGGRQTNKLPALAPAVRAAPLLRS